MVEYDIEGSLLEKGYDLDTKDDADGGNNNLKGGSGSSLHKKKNVVVGSNSDHESDFVEEMVRYYQKKRSGGKGKGIKGNIDDMALSPSDDELLAHRMERKQKSMRFQEEKT